jgi:peptide alpha-N-acetyltransferase
MLTLFIISGQLTDAQKKAKKKAKKAAQKIQDDAKKSFV